MLNIFKSINAGKAKLRELDPSTLQKIKEGSFLVKFISETQVAARKCEFYAGMSEDEEIKRTFEDEAKKLYKSSRAFQQYYESITRE
ncbi:MAG: hypothetical protein K6T80_03850 [Firmicutes bacterium]|nr:hypothetical protein [Bacillota bacterium]